MGLGSMMAGGNPADERGRQVNDWYPTPFEVTKAVMPKLRLHSNSKVWEPCAGNGAMVDEIKIGVPGISVFASDICSQRSDIVEANFFDYTEPPDGHDYLITNPPFNLAADIIDHAFKIGVKSMALVLKATYWHAKGRKALFDRHTPSFVMPLTWRPDFMGLGRPTMEISWVVWEPFGAVYPAYIPLSKPV
jgi:hypothetical protein